MRTITKSILFLIIMITSVAGTFAASAGGNDGFVTVQDGQFMLNGKPYRFIGTNMWYASILASEGEGGNRKLLCRELDRLKKLGVTNLRIMVGADGEEGLTSHVRPVLQKAPGVYNDTLLQGLDYLLVEMERRQMKGVFYLTNSWEWSGGYSAYCEWAGLGKALIPRVDGYKEYVNYVKQFVLNDKAKEMYLRLVRTIVGRTNSITGKPYSESPAIMAWQISNEPRAFSREGLDAFVDWLLTAARTIKSIDSRHLVSTGTEGKYGFEFSLDHWTKVHSAPEIDYAIIHIWPVTWRWVRRDEVFTAVDRACSMSKKYITQHHDAIKSFGKPLVLEEFGYHRDDFSFTPGSPTTARDRYYEYILSMLCNDDLLAACNFWAWSGEARPAHLWWEPWDDYTGDPAQEEQGLYSVFDNDKSTLKLIKTYTKLLQKTCK